MSHQKGMFKDYVDADEILLGTIKKHSFGIILMYVQTILAIVLILGLAVFVLPQFTSDKSKILSYVTLFGLVFFILAALILSVATIIYRQSSIVITDKNITQIIQVGLFNRKVSQLTMANVEDVSAEQRGAFATMLDYGVLTIETAGEQENFIFNNCPRPGYYAKIILEAREKFVAKEFPYASADHHLDQASTLSPPNPVQSQNTNI